MVTVLFIVIASLLLIIGLFVHGANTFGEGIGKIFTWLTHRMGPGVTYREEKVFPSHIVWYVLSAVAVVLAVILRKH